MEKITEKNVTLEKIVALCKRRGFVYQSAEIYGGLNGVYDFGPLGVLLKNNITQLWINTLKQMPEDVVFLDGSILGPESVWKASGHVENFNDPMVDCLYCKHRYRADELDLTQPCPQCKKTAWTDVRQFNMMFQTAVGATAEQSSIAYLRPETAQSIFINFKNVFSTTRLKIPFGIGQVGKAFRNEITPKQFLFRVREFEQMELEWFCHPEQSNSFFDFWREKRFAFYHTLGIDAAKIRLRDHRPDELAHYSVQCTDVEYEFPFGWKELEGIAHRGSFDLKQHMEHSGKDLQVYDDETKESYIPHVVECSVGVGRLFLTLLFDSYYEDEVNGEERIALRLHPRIAPIKAAFLPLTKKLSEPMVQLYQDAKKTGIEVVFDDSGSIGKRYRRYDEIGTPWCFTYDFDSEQDKCVTIRHRDTLQQERMAIDQVINYIANALK